MMLSHSPASQKAFEFTLSGSLTAVNLRSAALAAGWNGSSAVIATVASGARIASVSTVAPAIKVDGSFPGGVHLIIADSNAWVYGKGGYGGNQKSGNGGGNDGYAGHDAIVTTVPLTISNYGVIAPGGGGGGSGGGANTTFDAPLVGGKGGNGASLITAATAGSAGTSQPVQPYGGGTGGNGGTPAAGVSGSGVNGTQGYGWVNGGSPTYYGGGNGGLPGYYVNGNAYVTWLATGTRYGAAKN